ncbi:MAG: transcriptional repressor LexA [Eubacterium sp.]|nr:transcriptional repressor LexA [Eubacterium sp.]
MRYSASGSELSSDSNKERLSAKQAEILEFIKKNILSKGYPPSVREICDAVHLSSTSSVHSQLNKLEAKGYIRRDPTKPRTLEIVDDDAFNLSRREVVNVPLVGRVAAGEPLLAVENIENYIPVLPEYLPNAPTFMLRVKGDSMINVGIYDRDLLIVEETPSAKNGDIVVAMVDEAGGSSVTVKTFYKELNHIRLQPENDTMDPIIVPDCKILGRVVGVFRILR